MSGAVETAEAKPGPKFEIGERVMRPGREMIVQRRDWSGKMWCYVCTPANAKDKNRPLPFPERMLGKIEATSLDRAVQVDVA